MYNELLELWARYEELADPLTFSGTSEDRKRLKTLNAELLTIVQRIGIDEQPESLIAPLRYVRESLMVNGGREIWASEIDNLDSVIGP